MSTKKDSAAQKAAKAAKQSMAVATPVVKNHKSKGLKGIFMKMLTQWVSLVTTTVTFAGLLFITLAFDKYVLHHLFGEFAVGTDPWLVYLFKGAKYSAVVVELAFFVYGVYKDCKHHDE